MLWFVFINTAYYHSCGVNIDNKNIIQSTFVWMGELSVIEVVAY